MTKSEAGRMGGLATLNKHGVEHFKDAGQKGGRPVKDLQVILAQRKAVENKINNPRSFGRIKKRLAEINRNRAGLIN